MITKIVPVNYTDDLEELMRKDKCNYVGVEEMSVTYCQPPDTNSHEDEVQHLTLTTRMACSVGIEDIKKREGFYFDITIPEGEHWSIDSAENLTAIIEDFERRVYFGTEHLLNHNRHETEEILPELPAVDDDQP